MYVCVGEEEEVRNRRKLEPGSSSSSSLTRLATLIESLRGGFSAVVSQNKVRR